MFNLDARVQAKISRHIQRVLVADPNMATSYLLIDMLKGMGAHRCLQISTTRKALELCVEFQPQLIFVEYSGPNLDGTAFTSRLRRSAMLVRKAPVIVLSADTREASIKLARDAGAHEFLCKPFAAAQVFRRVQNVALKPRPWVESDTYVGPDRRRFNSGDFEGRRKRKADVAAAASELAFISADVSIRSQLPLLESTPQMALRNMLEQTIALQRVAAGEAGEGELSRAIGAFQRYLASAIDEDVVHPDIVEQYLDRIGALRHLASSARPPSPAHAVA